MSDTKNMDAAPASGAPDLPPLPDASLATGAELNAATFADFVKRLRHHVRGEGVDWHHTADALFTVQSREIIFGIDRDYTDKVAVAIEDTMYFSVQEYWDDADDQIKEQLEAMADGSYETPFLEVDEQDQWDMIALLDDHTVSGWDERWDYVNSHLTKEAADAFIKRKKHDYRRGMRVYVEAQVYCWEFNAIIKGLIDGKIALAQAAPACPASAPVNERAAFEAWHSKKFMWLSERDLIVNSNYADYRAQERWEGWQARAALAVKVEAQQAGVPEGWRDVIDKARESICAGGLSEYVQHERSIVGPHLDGIYDELEVLENTAAPLPPVVARKDLTNDEIIEIGRAVDAIEPSDNGGYFLPITFARAIAARLAGKPDDKGGDK